MQESSLETLAAVILPQDVKFAPSTLRDEFTSALGRLLLASPVLPTIAKLQRTLDSLDIEGLHALLNAANVPFSKEALEADIMANELFIEPNVADWVKFVSDYHSRHPPATHLPEAHFPARSELAVEDVRYHTLAYLLSMSFKDCSIISKLHPDGAVPDSVTVIDLDPKTVRKLTQWEQLDAEIVSEYAKLDGGSRKRCVDAGAPPRDAGANSTVQFLIVVTVLVTLFSFVLKPW